MFSEEVEDALERVEVKPEVKMEEDFEEEEAEGNNDVDYMVGVLCGSLISCCIKERTECYHQLATLVELALILVGNS